MLARRPTAVLALLRARLLLGVGLGPVALDGVVGDLLVDQLVDLVQEGAVVLGHEGDRAPRAAHARGSPDAVHVVLRVLGHVEVEHVGHALNVEPARGYVGRDHQLEVALAEALQDPLALLLAQVAVDLARVEARLAEALGDPVGPALGAREHDPLLGLFQGDEVLEEPDLPLGIHRGVELLDGVDGLLLLLALGRVDQLGVVRDLLG